jgi:integrase
MARKSAGPWYWKARGQWYCKHKGKQVPLGTDELDARRQWHILEATASVNKAGDANLFLAIADSFLDWIKRHKKEKTYKVYRQHLEAVCKVAGEVKVADLKPHHIDAVLAQHPDWGKATIRGVLVCVSTTLNWAVKQGLTTVNPLARRLPIPKVQSRGGDQRVPIPAEDYEVLLTHANPRLRDLLIACRNTGTRPHMVATVEARHFHEATACWKMDVHKTDETGKPLVVHLNPTMVALTKRLVSQHPDGPLFRNNRGAQWHDEVWGKAMASLRRQLEKKGIVLKSSAIMYGFRHAFATEQLEAGVPEAHVAALLGHSGTTMLHKHYSHLTSKHAALKEHLNNIKPTKGEGA